MDCREKQLTIENEFSLNAPYQFLFFVKEFLPIFKLFNLFKPAILNEFTFIKHSSPILITLSHLS